MRPSATPAVRRARAPGAAALALPSLAPPSLAVGPLAVALFALLPLAANAQGYPNRPVRVILPFAPGGGVDTVMRVLAQGLAQSTGHTFVLDNRPSDGGNVALELAAKAQADGHTILVSTPIIAVNPVLHPRVSYKVADFTAISLIGRAPALIVANPAVPAKTIAELIALAKAKPGSLRYGAPTGSGPYLAMEMFRHMAGIDIAHIPYKSSPAAVIDTVNGQIDLVSLTVPTTLPLVRANRLRALAQTGTTRLAVAADIPTLDEAGIKGYNVTTWYMALGPAQMPVPAIRYLNAEITRVLGIADIRKRLTDSGVDEIVGSTPAEATAFLREEASRWAKVLKPIRE